MFGRRVVQRELDSLQKNAVLVGPKHTDILSRLNGRHARNAVAAEWEVILLAALARQTDVEYEKSFGPKCFDLFVRSIAPTGSAVEFIADIVSVSDEHDSKRNPVRPFLQEFYRIVWKAGITTGGFDVRVGDRTIGRFPERRTQLLLPAKRDVPEFLKRHVSPFVRQVRAHPTVPQNFEWQGLSDISVSIKYDPRHGALNGGGYASYSSPMALKSNVLYRNLDDKASDLRSSGYEGHKGIVVVDAGCAALSSSDRRGGSPWGRGEIIEEFLKRHPYVDFVLSTNYEYWSWQKPPHTLRHHIYWQRPFSQPVIEALQPVLGAWVGSLPPIKDSPHNAQVDIRSGEQISRGCRSSWYGWTPRSRLAYSCRTFLRLVAGIITNEELRRLFVDNLPNRGPFFDFFRNIAESGATLTKVELIIRRDDDDDEIVFHLKDKSCTECPISPLVCEIPTAMLLNHFAHLAYEAIMDQHRFSIGRLAIPIQAFVRARLREGRLLVGAILTNKDKTLQLHFGPPDAAIIQFW